jgi:RHS repeat-associated protein
MDSGFAIPSTLSFSAVSNVVSTSDKDATAVKEVKVYEKIGILGPDNTVTGYVERAFYYDYLGRVIQTVEKNHLGGISRTSIKYDLAGNILKQHESHQRGPGLTADTKLTTFTYDVRGRMLSETTIINGSASGTVTYSYNELGKLTGKTFGNGATESMAYNIQGWLNSKDAVKSGTNLFSMNLLYYNSTRAANKFTGNIAEWQWTQGTASQNSYALSYDKLSRLLNSNRYVGGTSTNAFTEQNITYDKNGNITQLQRYGSTGSLQDNFTYNYNGATHNGNRLSSISGSVSATYAYDNNGNMTTDGRKNLAITYNVLNLQQSISQNSTTMAEYSYLSDGTKCGVVDNTTNGYDYLGSLIYNRSGSVRTLESAAFGGGRFVNTNNTILPYYYITDHLGSTRVITDNSGNVVERNDYYPFGGKHANSSYAQLTTNKQKFNGKELQTTGNTGFLDYGARMYDDVIGRWGVVDPMAEKYYPTSPYAYCDNNPVTNIDPNGMDWYSYEDEDGNVYYQYAEGDAGSIEVGGNTYDNIGSSVNIQLGGGMYFNTFQNYTVTSIDNPVDVKQMILNNPGLRGRLLASNSDFSKLGKTQIMESSVRKGQDDFLNNPVTKTAVNVLAMFLTGGIEGVTALGGAVVRSIGNIKVPIFRVFGGKTRAIGDYWWSLINPKFYGTQYRNLAGLPNSNSGAFTLKATTPLKNIILSTIKPAAPLDGNFGRLVPELKVFDKGRVVVKDFWVNF